MDARTGLPVVGMVGAGQLARMTHQAAIALGPSLRSWPIRPTTGPPWWPPTSWSATTGRWRTCATSPGAATWSPSTTSTCRSAHLRALAADGVTVAPGPGRAAVRPGQARDAGPADRARHRRARPAAAIAERGRASTAFGAGTAGRWCSRRPPAATTAGASGCSSHRRRPRRSSSSCSGRGTSVLARGAGDVPPRAGRRRRPLAVRAGRGLAGGRDRAARRHLRRGDRAGARPGRRAGRRGRSSWRCGWRPSSASSACSRSSCSRRPDGRLLVNELAMRPHNSGHWTIEGARTSQFEQHLRAVLDYPLGSTELAAPRRGDGQPARRADDVEPEGHRRARAPLHGPLARRQDPPLRQGVPPRPQGRPRHRARRRPGAHPRAGPAPPPTT